MSTNKKEYYLGKEFIINYGYKVKVISYINHRKVTIKFENGYTTETRIDLLKSGQIKNPYHPTTQGMGYLGVGEHVAWSKNKETKAFSLWNSMLSRAYCKKKHLKQTHYIGITVYKEWHNFQNFAKWVAENWNDDYMQDWQLDKDILVKGNKIYSPETCCFVPSQLNLLLTKRESKRGKYPIGVVKKGSRYSAHCSVEEKQVKLGSFNTPEEAFQAYKIVKEAEIKRLANKWKHLITPQVYQALINYQVEITD